MRRGGSHGDGEERPRRIRMTERGVVRRDTGRAGVRGQNWRDRTSAVFESPCYGSWRITAALRREGMQVNRKAGPRPSARWDWKRLDRGQGESLGHQISPYLLRSLSTATSHQVWGIAIPSIRLRHGWMYVVAVLDWYSRSVESPGTGLDARDRFRAGCGPACFGGRPARHRQERRGAAT